MKANLRGKGSFWISAGFFLLIMAILSSSLVVPCLSATIPSPVSARHTPAITPPAPVANFSADITTGSSPLTVHFSDASLNTPTSWVWDLDGNGRIDSQVKDPVYTYREPGVYSVTLTVNAGAGTDIETKKGYIVVTRSAPGPVAGFTSDITSGTAPLTVRFSDQSTNDPYSWEWDFDSDGRIDSREQNPSATYKSPGSYSVRLIVTNKAGADEMTRGKFITVQSSPETPAQASPVTPTKATPVSTIPPTTIRPSHPLTTSPAVMDTGNEAPDFMLFLVLFISAALVAAAYLLIRSRSSCSSGNETQELHLELSGGIDYGGELPPVIDPAEILQPGDSREKKG